MTSLPDALQKRIRGEGAKVIRKHLGVPGLLRLLLLIWREKRRMGRIDLDPVRGRGLTNQKFIDRKLQRTAMFSATAKIVGTERASET